MNIRLLFWKLLACSLVYLTAFVLWLQSLRLRFAQAKHHRLEQKSEELATELDALVREISDECEDDAEFLRRIIVEDAPHTSAQIRRYVWLREQWKIKSRWRI